MTGRFPSQRASNAGNMSSWESRVQALAIKCHCPYQPEYGVKNRGGGGGGGGVTTQSVTFSHLVDVPWEEITELLTLTQ